MAMTDERIAEMRRRDAAWLKTPSGRYAGGSPPCGSQAACDRHELLAEVERLLARAEAAENDHCDCCRDGKAENERLRVERDEARHALANRGRDNEALRSQVERWKNGAILKDQELATAEAENERLRGEVECLSNRRTTLQTEVERLDGELDAANIRATTARAENGRLREQCQQLNARVDDSQLRWKTMSAENARLQKLVHTRHGVVCHKAREQRDHHRETLRSLVKLLRDAEPIVTTVAFAFGVVEKHLRAREPWLFEEGER